MVVKTRSRNAAVKQADEALLAELGYKQEFKREFTPLEVRSPLFESTPTTITCRYLGSRFPSLGLCPLYRLCYSMPFPTEAVRPWSGGYVHVLG